MWLRRTQVILGPVQLPVGKGAGERRFSWNGFLGGEGYFDFELANRGYRDNQLSGGGRGLHDCCSGMQGGAEEGIDKAGQLFVNFAEDDAYCAQDQHLLSPECVAADRRSSIRGRLVAFHALR